MNTPFLPCGSSRALSSSALGGNLSHTAHSEMGGLRRADADGSSAAA